LDIRLYQKENGLLYAQATMGHDEHLYSNAYWQVKGQFQVSTDGGAYWGTSAVLTFSFASGAPYEKSNELYLGSISNGFLYRIIIENQQTMNTSTQTGQRRTYTSTIFASPTAPTAPTNVTIPTKCYQGKAVTVSYIGSSDVNGNLSGYEFQYKTNKVSWTNMTSSIVPASALGEGVTSLQVQVRAKDSTNLYSAWVQSNTCVIEPNRPPVFDGADEDLGVLREPPTVSFSVSDVDEGDAVNISIRVAGRVLKTLANVSQNAAQSYSLPAADFYALKSGSHILEIIATDKAGATATRRFSFAREVAAVSFICEPVETEGRAEKILLSAQFKAPEDAEYLWVCNNVYDEAPPDPFGVTPLGEGGFQNWELARFGQKHIFANKTTSSGRWGIGAMVCIKPTESCPEVFCTAPSGKYTIEGVETEMQVQTKIAVSAAIAPLMESQQRANDLALARLTVELAETTPEREDLL
jgi:hypothetical protein